MMFAAVKHWLTPRRTLIQSHLALESRVARLTEHVELLQEQRDALRELLAGLKWMACADSAAAKGFIQHLGEGK